MKLTIHENLFSHAVVFAEVDEGFDDGHGLNNLTSELLVPPPQLSLDKKKPPSSSEKLMTHWDEGKGWAHPCLRSSEPSLALRLSLNQVMQTFDFRQIHPACKEGLPSELAPFGEPTGRDRAQCGQDGREDRQRRM